VAKKRTLFECQSCGFHSAKWLGKCPNCGLWESFLELTLPKAEDLNKKSRSYTSTQLKAVPITEIQEDKFERFSSGSKEFDIVLGGGIVPGSLVLIGGSPGIGKSTLLLKIAGNLARNSLKVLYVSGEESAGQIKMRANRLKVNLENLYLLNEILLQTIISEVESGDYSFVVLDSVQTVYSGEISSASGSVSQVKGVTFELMRVAKSRQIPIFIIGHITKDGSIAGPRVLEHIVDTVLYFEGDSNSELRILRGFKNRFGSINEVGVFEMSRDGLNDAKSMMGRFFNRDRVQSGLAIGVIMEGSRALIVEVEALVADSFGHPKRSTTGYDSNRLGMILALLEKKLDLPLSNYDVFINISGGIRINETGADLAIVSAILSSFRDRTLGKETVFIGEVSLTGEIKDVPNTLNRLREAETQGFTRAILPSKPIQSNSIRCFIADEVAKIVEWIF
jgi:DNA repair protein RadA/Sms